MAKREEVVEQAEPVRKEGFWWWEREFFIQNMSHYVELLRADASLVPCVRETPEGLYFFTTAQGKASSGDGDGGFDNSHFCPPFCP